MTKEPQRVDVTDMLVDMIEEFEAEHPGEEVTFAALMAYMEKRVTTDELTASRLIEDGLGLKIIRAGRTVSKPDTEE